jgi:hypothetical protein
MTVKKTITSIFMVPSLKVPKNALKDNGFINAYVEDGDRDFQYPGAVYLLFLPEDIIKFREFLDEEYERTEQIIEDYDYEGGFVVVVYKLDPKWNKDFDLIRQGSYSKTSKNFQKMFPKVVKIKKNGLHKDEVSLQYRIFNKTEDMVQYWEDKIGIEWDDDLEVWSGYDKDEEILHIEEVKKNVKLVKQ